MTDDFKLLVRIAEKASEPFDESGDPNKTIGQYRKEIAALLTEVIFYVASKRKA